MKSLNSFFIFRSSRPNSQSSDVSHDCRLTVGSPSGLDAKWKQNPFMRFAVVLTLIFSIGVGNVWGADYQLIKSTDDLEVGAHYVLGASYNSTYYFIKTETNTNNRKLVTATVTNEKVSSVTGLMTFTLGGDATNGWTFKTDNYTGTAGYLNATNTTKNNYLKVVATLDNYAKFSVSITAAGVATIQCKGKSSRHIMYLNGTTCIACYSSKSGAQYVKLGIYKEVASCSVKPTVGSSLTSVSSTVNSITATVPISSIGGCNITENGLVYSTSVATPTVGTANCYTATTTACGGTAANKTVTISGLTCGQSYYVRGYATNAAGTSYTNVTTQSTSACPVYTVTLKDDNSTYTQASYGASVTLPSRAGCTGYTFAGWTKTWVTDQKEWTTIAPTIIPAGSYTPTANENLYPVYTKEEGGGSSTASSKSISSSSTSAVTLETSKPITYTCSASNTYSNPARIYKGNSITIAGGTITSISLTGVSRYAISNMTANTGTLTPDGNNGTRTGSASSVKFTASTGQTRISAISVTYAGGSTTSYISVPNCCTPLGSVNGSVSRSQT